MSINKDITFFNSHINRFSYNIYSPLVIFCPSLSHLKREIFEDIKKYMLPIQNIDAVLNEMENICVEEINHGNTIKQIERKVEKRLFTELFSKTKIFDTIEERAFRISNQLQYAIDLNQIPVSEDTNYLDFGCGSGVVASSLKIAFGFKKTVITDIVDYRYKVVKGNNDLKFELLDPFYKNITTYGSDFDLITITNVLHHSDEPKKTFEKVLKYLRTGGHMIIIESCIGIDQSDCETYMMQPQIPFQDIYDEQNKILEKNLRYLNYDFRHKMIYGIFFDWLYNRAFVNENINVPYNFGTPKNWNDYWEELGLKIKNTYLMGFDQPSVLEFHTMHVIQKL